MIKRSTHKSLAVLMLMFGVLFTSVAPSAMAQDGWRRRQREISRYERNRDYNRDYRYNDDYYGERESGAGKTIKRVGIGAAIGAVGGGLLGGKKGMIIGGASGAAGGYLYHRHKRNQERERYRY